MLLIASCAVLIRSTQPKSVEGSRQLEGIDQSCASVLEAAESITLTIARNLLGAGIMKRSRRYW